MKTAQIMEVNYAGIKVQQNHKTRMINATEFLERWNSSHVDAINVEGNQRVIIRENHVFKSLDNFKRLEGFDRYLAKVSELENIPVDKLIVSKRGKYGGTWVHELVFIKMLRWLSPEFEAVGDKILQNKILEYRDNSGESYKALCKAMDEQGLIQDNFDYARVAKLIALACLGTAERGQWNIASTEQLQHRQNIETFLTQAIESGFIKDINTLLNYINSQRFK